MDYFTTLALHLASSARTRYETMSTTSWTATQYQYNLRRHASLASTAKLHQDLARQFYLCATLYFKVRPSLQT